MTTELAAFVRLDGTDTSLRLLVRDIRSAADRARKAMPGERTDIVRFETLSAQLERRAMREFSRSMGTAAVVALPPSRGLGLGVVDEINIHEQPSERHRLVSTWVTDGDIAVELRMPLSVGATPRREQFQPSRQPEKAWPVAPEGTTRKQAIAQRFEEQISATLELSDPPSYIEPSGVSNSVLTETLRRFVAMSGHRTDAPVRYQDGSTARPFPLRSLALGREVPALERELRFALLSIRHAEMDVDVDGCWLRNFDISRPRPAGETDEVSYELSRAQLSALTRHGPVLIRLYQTGLDAAVVGFYRAVVEHLLESPGSIAIVPTYYREPPSGAAVRTIGGFSVKSYFAEGLPWMTA